MIYNITLNTDYKVKDPKSGLQVSTPAFIINGVVQDSATRITFRTGSIVKIDTAKLPLKELPASIQRMIDKGILKIVQTEENSESKKEEKIKIATAEKPESDADEKVAYETWLKKDLQAELNKRGIEFADDLKKDELIKLLHKSDVK